MAAVPLPPDIMPPPAGIVYDRGEGGAANCVREESRPDTPPAISKWRRSGTSQPGQRVLHPGQIGDVKEIDPKMSFGRGGVKASDHVADVWCQARNIVYTFVASLNLVYYRWAGRISFDELLIYIYIDTLQLYQCLRDSP